MKGGIIFLILLVGIPGLAQSLSGTWKGKLYVFPKPNLSETKLILKTTLAGWSVKSESIFFQDAFDEQLFYLDGYLFGYRVTVEGKASFSPVGKLMKRVCGELLDGTKYDQLVWEFPGPFYKYSWIKGTIPFLWGEVSAKARHRMPYYSEDIRSLYWNYGTERAYRWDANQSLWVPTYKDPECVGKEAFVGAARIKYRTTPGSGRWYYRWENYLLLIFDPQDPSDRPFRLSPEAVAYLNTKYPEWEFMYWREDPSPYFKVYHWMKPSMEYTLNLKPELLDGFGTAKLEALFTDCSSGIRFSELTLELSNASLCCGMKADVNLTRTKEGFTAFAATIKGLSLCCGIDLDLGITWTVSEKSVVLEPSWKSIAGCVSVYGDVATDENVITGIKLYGVRLSCRLGGLAFKALHVLERPPYPYPGWYQSAYFKKVAATGKYENELVSLSHKWRTCCGTAKLELSAYLSEGTESLFGITRFTFYASIPLTRRWTVGLSLWTDDPSTIPVEPSLLVSWEFKF